MKSLVGNKKVFENLSEALASENLSHAYLFSGPVSVGKTTAALEMARVLLCADGGEVDCLCPNCRQVSLMAHPDLHFLEGEVSGIEEIREITRQLALAPYQSRYRVAVIAHAQKLTIPALNSFLKTLEEPKKNTVIILTTENKGTLLSTIVSRTRQVTFGTISEKEIFEYLNREKYVKKDLAQDLSVLASGRIGMAVMMAEESGDANSSIKEGENFLRIYRSESIADKISLAGKIAGDKEDLRGRLVHLSVVLRNHLLQSVTKAKKEDTLMVISALDGLAKAEGLLMANINTKIVIESLLLRSL